MARTRIAVGTVSNDLGGYRVITLRGHKEISPNVTVTADQTWNWYKEGAFVPVAKLPEPQSEKVN